MFVGVYGKGDNAYVYLMKSFRDTDGKVKKERCKNFGKLNEILKKDPQGLEKLKEQYREPHAQKRARETEAAAKIIDEGLVSGDELEVPFPRLNFSYYLFRKIWEDELGMHELFRYLQNNDHERLEFDLNAVAAVQTLHRMILPGSVCDAYTYKACLLGAPLEGVSLDQMYVGLRMLHTHKNLILRHINRRLDTRLKRNYTMVFYDVTNAYFESPLTDEERNNQRENSEARIREIIDRAVADGQVTVPEQGSVYDLPFDAFPPPIRSELRRTAYLKMRGLSKEHRYDLPLVSVALVIDENAIPIDFEIFSGCASEYVTMQTSIDEMRERYNIKEVIVVADRGLNSAANLQMLLDHGYGFAVAQKVSNLKREYRNAMLDETGYETVVIRRGDGPDAEEIDTVRFKTIENFIKEDKEGNRISCTLLVTHSQRRAARDEEELNSDIARAQRAVDSGQEVASGRRAWNKLVTKDGNTPHATGLNQAAIDERRRLCGYYGVVFHAVPNTDNQRQEAELSGMRNAYRHLVQIEDCFRVMKHTLGLRPMYVRREDSIQGHVMCCVLGLIVIRLLMMRLRANNNELSPDEIQNALRDAQLTAMFHRDQNIASSFLRTSDYRWLYKGREKLTRKEMADLSRQGEFARSNLDQIITSLGLTIPPRACDRHTLAKCLGTRFGSEEAMIDSAVHQLVTQGVILEE